MSTAWFITHPDIVIDPARPVPRWRLSNIGIARMRAYAAPPALTAIWASTEAKAIEAAGLLAAGLGLPVGVDAALGENDRSATGYLPQDEFETMADLFFGRPEDSICGWETAVDAQARIVAATTRLLEGHTGGDVAFVAHGAVGALLLCALLGEPISRAMDQPGAGCVFAFGIADRRVIHRWHPL